jgi:hypothetical protein
MGADVCTGKGAAAPGAESDKAEQGLEMRCSCSEVAVSVTGLAQNSGACAWTIGSGAAHKRRSNRRNRLQPPATAARLDAVLQGHHQLPAVTGHLPRVTRRG